MMIHVEGLRARNVIKTCFSAHLHNVVFGIVLLKEKRFDRTYRRTHANSGVREEVFT